MLKVPYTDLKSENLLLEDTLVAAFKSVLLSGDYILSTEVSDFESQFAKYCGAKYCLGVHSGLEALVLILQAYGIGVGDEVIVPTNSFIASAIAISRVGAIPVFCDVDDVTFNINPKLISSLITPKTKAVIGVHLYGHPFDVDEVRRAIDGHPIVLIEDAAQAHGADYSGKQVGNLGDAAAFSFYPTKNLGALGDAGAIVSNDSELMERIAKLRNYGALKKYHHELIGTNSRLSCIQAACLKRKLSVYPDQLHRRQYIAQQYLEGIPSSSIQLPTTSNRSTHAWHVFAVHTQFQSQLLSFLDSKGIGTNLHYPTPIHLQPCYVDLGYSEGNFPVAERLSKQTVSIPLYPQMSDGQVEYVIQCLNEFEA